MMRFRIWLYKWLLRHLAEEHLELLAHIRTNRQDRARALAKLEELERIRSRRQTRRVIAQIARRRPLSNMEDVH